MSKHILKPTKGLEDLQASLQMRGEIAVVHVTARRVGEIRVVGSTISVKEFDALASAQHLLQQGLIYGETFTFEQLCEVENQVLALTAPLMLEPLPS